VGSLLDPKHLIYQRSKEIMFRPMININHNQGRFLSLAYNFRGNISEDDIKNVYQFPDKFSSYFCAKFNNNFKVNFNKRPAVCYGEVQEDLIGATVIGNGTSIQERLKAICGTFTSMFRRKAFMHHYMSEGIDEMEFCECESRINDLISSYQQTQDEV
jgi:tubulin beta